MGFFHAGDGTPVEQDVLDGQAVYTPRILRLYDFVVFRICVPLFWRCPPAVLRRLYDSCVGAKHLEIGVGTGYLLSRVSFPVAEPHITLLDLNPNTLAYTARRLPQYQIKQIVANALEPLPVPPDSHDSVAMSFLLHCVPGSLREKGRALRYAASVVRPGGVVFGNTILSSGARVTLPARRLMRLLNKRGIFHNNQDNLADLQEQLNRHFDRHELVVYGSVAVFRAWTAS